MSRLNHTQIGLLANYIETVMASYSNTFSPSVSAINDLDEMEPWEAKLKELIDSNPLLPSYDDIQKDHEIILEGLIEYFTPENNEDALHLNDSPRLW